MNFILGSGSHHSSKGRVCILSNYSGVRVPPQIALLVVMGLELLPSSSGYIEYRDNPRHRT